MNFRYHVAQRITRPGPPITFVHSPYMRIAHLSAEVTPFAKSGGLGDVVGSLPKALAELGHDVTVWMPLYREVWETLRKRGIEPEVACEPFHVGLGFHRQKVGILPTY